MPAPQPKSEEIARLVNIELEKPRSDDITLKRLEREANALRVDPDGSVRGDGLSLLGVIEGLRFDTEGAKKCFEQALAATGNSPLVCLNYASILAVVGSVVEALALAERGLAKVPDDVALLRLALRLATDVMDVEKAEHFANRLRALNKLDDDIEVRRALHSMGWQRTLLSMPGILKDSLMTRYLLARSIAFVHRVRISEERTSTSPHGVLVEWSVGCDGTEIDQMNMQVVDALSELAPDPGDLVMAFGFTQTDSRSA